MKKLIISILLATMLVINGHAEDYTSMSVDELLEARTAIDQALYELGYMTVLLPGEYLVGEDIPAGRYRVERHDDGEVTGEWRVHIEAYDGADDYVERNFLQHDEEQVGITLEDGQILYVYLAYKDEKPSSTLTIAKITPLFQD